MRFGVVIQPSFLDAIRMLPDEQRLELYDGICNYGVDGMEPEQLSPQAHAMFILMKPVIESSRKRYQTSLKNGRKGGAPKGNQNARKQPKNNHDIDIDKDIDNDTDTDKDMDMDTFPQPQAAECSPMEWGEKHPYGEFQNVLLSDKEVEKLRQEVPDWQELTDRLSEYIASSGKRYKSHYATLRAWARREPAKPNAVYYPEVDLSGIL